VTRAALLVLLAACGGSARSVAPPRALLVVTAEVPDATLWIDEAHIGAIADLGGGVRLRAGTHRIELRHDRHHTRYAEVTLLPGERKVLALHLAEALP
jgi:hypothetical protein